MSEGANEQLLLARERTFLAQERNRSALERTFLAWLRTGLACVGGGIAVIRLLTFEQPIHILYSHIIGSTLVLVGILVFFLSYLDYRTSYKNFSSRNNFAGSLVIISILTFILVVISIGLLIITI